METFRSVAIVYDYQLLTNRQPFDLIRALYPVFKHLQLAFVRVVIYGVSFFSLSEGHFVIRE